MGSGQSFVVSLYSGYQSLTVDNFVAEIANTVNGNTASGLYISAVNADSSCALVKSYDASTGKLTCYYRLSVSMPNDYNGTNVSRTYNVDAKVWLIK